MQWPSALSATGTHDTKRGEDVRSRINALSELPNEWKQVVSRWRSINRRLKNDVNGLTAPDANEEYLIYQMLVGAWPLDAAAEHDFPDRFKTYLMKALREAKVHTNWLTPDEDYERAVMAFVDQLLSPRRPFLGSFLPFQRRVAEIGVVNSLAQLLIKCTAPGVPDFYQGTELWDFSFVDPDNRRPVDYGRRAALLAELTSDVPGCQLTKALVDSRHDGRVKLFTITRALATRHALRDTFAIGSYVPLRTAGTFADQVFAFARVEGGRAAITCVPRLVASLPGGGSAPPLGREAWADTTILLPDDVPATCLVDSFTRHTFADERQDDGERRLLAADVFGHFPIALLTATRDTH